MVADSDAEFGKESGGVSSGFIKVTLVAMLAVGFSVAATNQ